MLSYRYHRAALPAVRHIYSRQAYGFRYASLEAGENKTGHINAGPNEGVLFFNNIFPSNLQWLFRLPFATQRLSPKQLGGEGNIISAADPHKVISQALPEGAQAPTAQVTEVLPRFKEGGAFVKFTRAPDTTNESVEKVVQDYSSQKRIKPWWNPLGTVKAHLVLGRPWVEDLYRLPSPRLRVEFLPTASGETPAELTQEQSYELFRPYGKLADILAQPSDSKVLPKYALVDFARIRKAVAAKNCMHGYVLPEAQGGGKTGTVLKLSFEAKQKTNWIKDWSFSHPRIVIPALAALIAGITVAVFDPIRTLFIKAHITRTLHSEDNRLYRWFQQQANAFSTRVRSRHETGEEAGMEAIWEDRKENIEQIQTWLMETADTFIVVQGPRGTGKKELVVDQALKDRKNTLVIDCKPIQEARGDAATISAAADQVGYRPVFSWMNSISGLIDLAAQGATGLKTGFSETSENQSAKIWNNTATALKQIALEGRKKDDKDANSSDDEYLEAHPERRPVVVIDNFLHKSQEGSIVYDKLAEWASRLTTSNIAHVVFLTNDVSFSKSLSKALPDRVFRQIGLSDTSPQVAKRYVISHSDYDAGDADAGLHDLTPSQRRKDSNESDDVLPLSGGRLTDLEFLARRIKAGETPSKAVKEIIEQSASEILKMFSFGNEDGARQWTPMQAWMLIKQLASSESLRYNEISLADAYKTGGERASQALEQAESISIQSSAGRPYAIKPGKPVYQPAFQRSTEDKVLQSRSDSAVSGESIKEESKSIDKYEQESHSSGESPKQPAELTSRVMYSLQKIQASQTKIEAYEKESGGSKKISMSEY